MLRTENNAIYLTRGDSASLEIRITRADGTVYFPAEGDELTFTLKRSVRDEESIISKKASADGKISIEPSDTAGLAFGEYRYDVQLNTKEGKVYTVVEPDSFFVCEEVTV